MFVLPFFLYPLMCPPEIDYNLKMLVMMTLHSFLSVMKLLCYLNDPTKQVSFVFNTAYDSTTTLRHLLSTSVCLNVPNTNHYIFKLRCLVECITLEVFFIIALRMFQALTQSRAGVNLGKFAVSDPL